MLVNSFLIQASTILKETFAADDLYTSCLILFYLKFFKPSKWRSCCAGAAIFSPRLYLGIKDRRAFILWIRLISWIALESVFHREMRGRGQKRETFFIVHGRWFRNCTLGVSLFGSKPSRHCRHVSVFKTFRFRSPQYCIFKFVHRVERFQKVPFSVFENTLWIWTEGQTG